MNAELLEKLSPVTDEERDILSDRERGINRSLYYSEGAMSRQNEIDASRLLTKGKLIDIRPNTRFVHFPRHTHNFVEFVYMCEGTTTHIIDGHTLTLKEGDLLFMNQHAQQEILPAGEHDIAVNFIILPPFFDSVLHDIGDEPSALRDFVISCLTEKNMGGNYLYFDVAGILPIQNLMENLIWIMLYSPRDRRTLSQQTMALLFLNLMGYADRVRMPDDSYEQNVILKLLDYIEGEYKDAALSDFAQRNRIDIYTLGRIIKKNTGKTFTDLLARKRMEQAAWLLTNTSLAIADISVSVGYENTSYFYRLFKKTYGRSPRMYRHQS